MVVVNGWTDSELMRRLTPLMNWMERIGGWVARRRILLEGPPEEKSNQPASKAQTGTYIQKWNAKCLKNELASLKPEIRVWRSVSVRFLRSVIHGQLAGRLWLKLLFWLEERFPRYLGEKGQYPLIIIRK